VLSGGDFFGHNSHLQDNYSSRLEYSEGVTLGLRRGVGPLCLSTRIGGLFVLECEREDLVFILERTDD
jgi:hypothetical protein